ncbi:hypothetical protein F4781DRAFT_293149 [Annulohypoxylon bovei var. microspora]|nr:hypothetical protein F4781DRAFT_293149 [Annulohypoxylon bovei var. microspora]
MSEGSCAGGSKNPLLTHFNREERARAYKNAVAVRLQERREEELLRDALRFPEFTSHEFNEFQTYNASLNEPFSSATGPYQPFNNSVGPISYEPRPPPSGPSTFKFHGRPTQIRPTAREIVAQNAHLRQDWSADYRYYQSLTAMATPGHGLSRDPSHGLSSDPSHGFFLHDRDFVPQSLVRGPPTSLLGPPMVPEPIFAPQHSVPMFNFDAEFANWMADNAVDNDESRSGPAPAPTLAPEALVMSPMEAQPASAQEEATASTENMRKSDDSRLAVAAQEILDSMSGNTSDKFQQSEFLVLMRRLASMDLVVRDNALVEASTVAAAETESTSSGSSTIKPTYVDRQMEAAEMYTKLANLRLDE